MTLLELADACERAKGADRELDAAISRLVEPDDDEFYHRYESPRYTALLDAAMQLVPEGCFPHVGKSKGMPSARTWYADCAPANRTDWLDDEWFCETEAATPALALASAALRARHAMENENG